VSSNESVNCWKPKAITQMPNAIFSECSFFGGAPNHSAVRAHLFAACSSPHRFATPHQHPHRATSGHSPLSREIMTMLQEVHS
jgi:hypothetical protein